MNLALAQEAIFRTIAEANFQTERRYGGVRVEVEKTIAAILEQRVGVDVGATTRGGEPFHSPPSASPGVVVDRPTAEKRPR